MYHGENAESSFSAEVSVTSEDTTPAAVPAGLTATSGDRSVTLAWEENADADIRGYNVYMSLTSGDPYTKVNSSAVPAWLRPPGWTQGGLNNGHAYYFVVTSVDLAGNESALSSEVGVTAGPYGTWGGAMRSAGRAGVWRWAGAAKCLLGFCVLVSSAWAQEVPTAWQLVDDGDAPAVGGTVPFAYDSARQRAVAVYGGLRLPPGSAFFPGSTWELVGEDGVRRFPPEPTPGWWNNCAAFDEARGVVVLFGENDEFGKSNETWEYDGKQWVKRQLTTNPLARNACGLTYDSARGVVVLSGGWGAGDGTTPLGDT